MNERNNWTVTSFCIFAVVLRGNAAVSFCCFDLFLLLQPNLQGFDLVCDAIKGNVTLVSEQEIISLYLHNSDILS